ncbi:CBS domain-containing protein [Streptomyces sp. ICBB 8177]|uniref:CBS domain-containing protein n=1 Tax=Streptomyces sp. ICBB 8177 TaxID=563922 RepID=UPI000D67BB04|nr:CBS domain-containing protein [Streptomyces sp. ICBB 8177]PWI45097.1 hypothetical protein CK485_05830 [Streptomyces sp. ICBB 8177]
MIGSPHTVSDVMSHTVVAVGRDASFKAIVETLRQWRVSALPVLEGGGRVIGVVSEADLLPKEEHDTAGRPTVGERGTLAEFAKARATTAEQLMSTPAVTIHADATLGQAARVMAHARLKRLPVVDAEGRLTGLVGRSGLLKVFLREDEEIEDEVRREVISSMFATTSPSVEVSVRDGVVSLHGRVGAPELIPVAVQLCRAVEGVVDVACELTGPSCEPPVSVGGPLTDDDDRA